MKRTRKAVDSKTVYLGPPLRREVERIAATHNLSESAVVRLALTPLATMPTARPALRTMLEAQVLDAYARELEATLPPEEP